MLVGQREKSQQYFDLSASNWNLNDSNPWSSLGAMNVQKWEHFSGSPGTVVRRALGSMHNYQAAKILNRRAL